MVIIRGRRIKRNKMKMGRLKESQGTKTKQREAEISLLSGKEISVRPGGGSGTEFQGLCRVGVGGSRWLC